jgi:hypothetical protein
MVIGLRTVSVQPLVTSSVDADCRHQDMLIDTQPVDLDHQQLE